MERLKEEKQYESLLDCSDPVINLATNLVKRGFLPWADVINWRWEMELTSGIIEFDPNDPAQYKERKIGRFILRHIPNRAKPDREKMSDHTIPVLVPFEDSQTYFDYNIVPLRQDLLRVQIGENTFRLLASNSPLTYSPHTLLVPLEDRTHFLEKDDLETAFCILEENPGFSIIFSSMGAGSGVNHMHLHLIAGEEDFPVSNARRTSFHESGKVNIEALADWPTDSYILRGDLSSIIEDGYEFVNFLQSTDTPHNLFINKGELWINPRARKISTVLPEKKFGTWETILGICNACSLDEYEAVNEESFSQALQEILIDPEQRNYLDQELLKIVE